MKLYTTWRAYRNANPTHCFEPEFADISICHGNSPRIDGSTKLNTFIIYTITPNRNPDGLIAVIVLDGEEPDYCDPGKRLDCLLYAMLKEEGLVCNS